MSQNNQSELEALKRKVASLTTQLEETTQSFNQIIENKDQQIHSLYHQLHILKTAKYGRKTERYLTDKQLDLFDEITLESEEAYQEEVEEVTVTKTVKKTKKGGKQTLPKHLPYIEEVHDLTKEEKQCPCGCELSPIGEEKTERLDVLPKLAYRVVHIRKKYACKSCEQSIQTAKLPTQLIPQGVATPGLISAVIDAKFNRHMPLYRQEDEFKCLGVKLTRATLSHWLMKVSEELTPLIKLMHDEIVNYDIAYADETTLQVLKKKDKPPTSKSYMWLFAGGPPDKRAYIYQYQPGRREATAFEFFDGFKGYVHADCYRAYVNLGKEKAIHHVACMAHARRHFMDIVKANTKKKGLAHQAVEIIRKLYHIEAELKEQKATTHAVYQTRQEKSLPILNELKKWLDEKTAKVPPKSPIAKAMSYSITHWKALNRYLEDGRLDIDNNLSERAIKPFVIGRKNWLFHGNEKGAKAGAVIYSLIETCKAHEVDVFAYFKFVLANIKQAKTLDDLNRLLPYNCNKAQLKSMRDIPKLVYPN